MPLSFRAFTDDSFTDIPLPLEKIGELICFFGPFSLFWFFSARAEQEISQRHLATKLQSIKQKFDDVVHMSQRTAQDIHHELNSLKEDIARSKENIKIVLSQRSNAVSKEREQWRACLERVRQEDSSSLAEEKRKAAALRQERDDAIEREQRVQERVEKIWNQWTEDRQAMQQWYEHYFQRMRNDLEDAQSKSAQVSDACSTIVNALVVLLIDASSTSSAPAAGAPKERSRR